MKKSSATHHQTILDDVRSAIISGEWPPGYRIPFENDMAATYGVSRMTVNKALTQLAREGFIERRRKVGSFVSAPRVQSAVVEINDLKAEVNNSGRLHGYQQLTREERTASAGDLQLLNMETVSAQVLALTGLHSADGAPYCLEERLINLDVVPEAQQVSFEHEPAGSWLLRQVPWSSAQHKIRAVGATPAEAKLLQLPLGTPCLEIQRLTQSNGQAVTFARLLYPGDRHQLIARFTPAAT